jgi:hypothetical protein
MTTVTIETFILDFFAIASELLPRLLSPPHEVQMTLNEFKDRLSLVKKQNAKLMAQIIRLSRSLKVFT